MEELADDLEDYDLSVSRGDTRILLEQLCKVRAIIVRVLAQTKRPPQSTNNELMLANRNTAPKLCLNSETHVGLPHLCPWPLLLPVARVSRCARRWQEGNDPERL